MKQGYHARERLWASYGDYDQRQFERNCRARGIAYPFGPGHLNIKSLFAVTHALPREVGMARALEILGLPLEGAHHRAGDDAWNITRILRELLCKGRGKVLSESKGRPRVAGCAGTPGRHPLPDRGACARLP